MMQAPKKAGIIINFTLISSIFLAVFSACGSSSSGKRDDAPTTPPDSDNFEDGNGLGITISDGESAPAEKKVDAGDCEVLWNRWLNTYSSASPYQTYNKNSDWSFTQDQVDQVEAERDLIRVSGEHFSEGEAYDTFSLDEAKSISFMDKRDRDIVEKLLATIEETPEDTLLLVHLGLAHALDLFFDARMPATVYAQYPVRTKTQFFSKSFYDFMGMIDDPEPTRLVADNSLVFPIILSGKLGVYVARHGAPARTKLFPKKTKASNIVLLGDVHGVNETSLASSLPTSNCLKELGYSSVKVAMEGFHHQDPLSLADIDRALDFRSILGDEQIASLSETRPKAHALLNSGKVQLYPNVEALIIKLFQYESKNIPVEYVGFESSYESTFLNSQGDMNLSISDLAALMQNRANQRESWLPFPQDGKSSTLPSRVDAYFKSYR